MFSLVSLFTGFLFKFAMGSVICLLVYICAGLLPYSFAIADVKGMKEIGAGWFGDGFV